MSKFLKVLAKAKSIIKYLDVFHYIQKGLVVAHTALESTIMELKRTIPEFKYIEALETVDKYVLVVKSAVDKFLELFGIACDKIAELENEASPKDADFISELNECTANIEKLIEE